MHVLLCETPEKLVLTFTLECRSHIYISLMIDYAVFVFGKTGPIRIKKSLSFNVTGEVINEIRADADSCLADCLW